ncbi:nuclear transport factor 2 family protein [Chamaesiphon sp. VAR_48_metabat_135_sub]|uniref:nuclear transport factor 2 family protein n=1 Tax=Chamaesiphon sp. VAR_48_metabat_135_sub TaxID=2964699 RepID=UPI00286C026D|nr:nuclear transport factor 2 family protein [Chamaesiphon sp. VAR_48_metabat_135_sub]
MKTTISNNVSTSSTEPLILKIDIQGIHEPIIYEYFARLNNGEFTATAELFAAQGCLNPPFDKQLQGREAIAQYLEKEAKGIKFLPEYGEILTSVGTASSLDSCDRTQYQIQGKVEINWFTVNISWSMQLNSAKEIMLIEVKLLADLEDLLSFSRI